MNRLSRTLALAAVAAGLIVTRQAWPAAQTASLKGDFVKEWQSQKDTLVKIAGTVAVAFGTINIVGGFLVTDRMLEMFKSKPKPPAGERGDAAADHAGAPSGSRDGAAGKGEAP